MRHIDAEAVNAAVGPEPQRGVEVLTDLRVVPVKIGLFRGEKVQVPLPQGTGLGSSLLNYPRPGTPAKAGGPIGRRQLAVVPQPIKESGSAPARGSLARQPGLP